MQLFGGGHKFVTDADHIAGRNYLLNTSQPISVKGVNRVAQTLATFYPAKDLKNQLVTFKIEVLADKDGGTLFVGSGPSWAVYKQQEIKKGLNTVEFTGTLASDFGMFLITIDNSSANLTLTNATLNLGTVAKEWQPAIEDYVINNGLMKLFDLSKNNAPNPDNLASKTFDLNSKWYGMKVAQTDVPINGKENWSLYFDFELNGFDRIQLNISVNSNIYIRTFSGSGIWSDWKQIGK